MGSIHKTLFILKQGTNTLLVQIYVDDIVFAGSYNALLGMFVESMSNKFEMSMTLFWFRNYEHVLSWFANQAN